jgi:hypothetical protein
MLNKEDLAKHQAMLDYMVSEIESFTVLYESFKAGFAHMTADDVMAIPQNTAHHLVILMSFAMATIEKEKLDRYNERMARIRDSN